MNYIGFYINLDRSTARRAEIEAQFVLYGLQDKYRRFIAADGNTLGFPNPHLSDGELGCFLSHYLLLKENLGTTQALHVIEDDVVFSSFAGDAIASLVDGRSLAHYDIVYTDVHVPISNVVYKKYKDLFEQSVQRNDTGAVTQLGLNVVDLKNVGFASTASMIISPNAVSKLHDLYHAELVKGADRPIDLFIRQKTEEGVLNVATIFPFVTSVRLEQIMDTTLGDQDLRRIALAGTIARHSFFVACDQKKTLAYTQKYLPLPEDDAQLQILTHVLSYAFGPQFDFG